MTYRFYNYEHYKIERYKIIDATCHSFIFKAVPLVLIRKKDMVIGQWAVFKISKTCDIQRVSDSQFFSLFLLRKHALVFATVSEPLN